MPSQREIELRQSLLTYEALIANYTRTRERLIERRRGAADHVMVELDERLEANERTVNALLRAVTIARDHLRLEEQATLHTEGTGRRDGPG
jgi:hypothetical protein